jgi:hypothetical protein
MDIEGIGCEDVDGICMAQDRDEWLILFYPILIFRVL